MILRLTNHSAASAFVQHNPIASNDLLLYLFFRCVPSLVFTDCSDAQFQASLASQIALGWLPGQSQWNGSKWGCAIPISLHVLPRQASDAPGETRQIEAD